VARFDALRDPRLDDAIDIVRTQPAERWALQNSYRGIYFEMERLGAPSRWNTLCCTARAELVGSRDETRLKDVAPGSARPPPYFAGIAMASRVFVAGIDTATVVPRELDAISNVP
jgi:hypothetical protein